MARYQPYVEDYNSELSEAIPLTRRQTTKRSSGLANSTSVDASSYEAESNSVSDSGYSSHAEATTPTETPPPQKAAAPAPPPRTQSARPSRSASNPAPPPFTRPSSKSFSRTASPAAPRNIPSSYNTVRRESSPATSTGGSDDCDCPDCGKVSSKPVPSGNSPSRSGGVWPVPEHSYHGSYSSSPSSAYTGYQYPSKYDGYNDGAPAKVVYVDPIRESSSSRRERSSTQSSMPPPPRPLSTFAGSSTTTSSHTPSGSWSQSSYNPGYFGSHHSSSPAPAPPTPASTCPPSYGSSMYAPPPIDTSVSGPSPHPTYDSSPYAPPSSVPGYVYSYSDSWGQSPMPQTPNYHQAPEPSYHPAPEYSSMPPPPPIMNRRSSMRAQANAGAATLESSTDYPLPQVSHHHRERRPSNRVHSGSERPPSWYGHQQFQDVPSRSVSVPPVQTEPPTISSSSRRRMAATPQPIRRRDSNTSRGSGGPESSRLPSSLSRSMETCAIDDEPPHRSSHHGHSHHRSSGHYEYHHGALARRDTGTLMQSSRSNRSSDSDSSGHSYNSGREELVVLDSDEPFTMRYPAGVPVKLQLNGGHIPQTISLGSRDKNENIEFSIAYNYVQQSQQQVHAQLQHGAIQMEHYDRRTTASEYPHRSYERQRV